MGRKFGTITKASGVVHYGLSPHEQKAFPKFFSKVLPNTFRRIKGKCYILLFMVAFPVVVNRGNYLQHHYQTKAYLAEHPEN